MRVLDVLMLLGVALNTVGSNTLLKLAGRQIQFPQSSGQIGSFIAQMATNPLVWSSLALQAMGYVAFMFVLSRVKLAVAVGVMGAFFYAASAASGWLLLGEKLSMGQIGGLVLIAAGVSLLGR
jgi:multidrug transporter EmrE-like cation transporter